MAKPSHLFLATVPKCGTAWLKALIFSTMHRSPHDFSSHPLLTASPHGCVPFLERQLVNYQNDTPNDLVSHYGPYWDHVLGHRKASLESPNKVLFSKYENMKREPLANFKRLAEFMGWPFTEEEEREGVSQAILELCSFENNLEVNKLGVEWLSDEIVVKNSEFFRKGVVGDCENYWNLKGEMTKCLDRITEEKFIGCGLNCDKPPKS
ncbi:P-loop containing nucleoside triphosphate hydrolases superfamily protein [Actinidia rufa]|uniref:Sulfotransferase n=1 Tax=Actinidia rufa TaxID=165716 RepID=A0A7J0EGQ5_9ERIC|nr:P-loop containing nucleoside triphosphate hydrolases superfamily protein [Actinidia rufa]